jgi:hypothetical protein
MLCDMNGTTRRDDVKFSIESLEQRTMLSITGLPIDIGSTGFDTGKRVIATPDGGFIDAGIFSGTVDFATGSAKVDLTSQGNSDVYVAKYSATGRLQWVDQFGGDAEKNKLNNQDNVNIASDPARAGGNFVNGVSSDPSQVGEYVNDLAVSADGSVYVIGNFIGSVDFDPGSGQKIFHTFDNSYYDAYVLKLTAGGRLNWADQIGGRFTDTANALSLDTSGNIFLTGLFTRTVTFAPGITLNADGRADGYVLELNNAGTVQWVNQFGSDATGPADRDAGLDVAVDNTGDVYVVGTIAGKSTFSNLSNPGTILQGSDGTDGFVAKYTTSGTLVRVVGYSGKDFEGVNNVAVDLQGNVIITGYFDDDLFDADPTPGKSKELAVKPAGHGNARIPDSFVEKLSPNLRLQWVQQLAGNGNELIDQLKIDSSNNIVLGGSFYGRASFGKRGPSITSVPNSQDFNDPNDQDRENSYDAFLWKLDTNGGTAWVRTLGAASDDFGTGIDIAADDSILFTGRFRGTTDFDTTAALRRLRGLGLADAFVTGFAADGTPLFDEPI